MDNAVVDMQLDIIYTFRIFHLLQFSNDEKCLRNYFNQTFHHEYIFLNTQIVFIQLWLN